MAERMTDAAREAQRAYMREWRKKNPERVREKNQRYWERKAKQIQENVGHANGGEADAEAVAAE